MVVEGRRGRERGKKEGGNYGGKQEEGMTDEREMNIGGKKRNVLQSEGKREGGREGGRVGGKEGRG